MPTPAICLTWCRSWRSISRDGGQHGTTSTLGRWRISIRTFHSSRWPVFSIRRSGTQRAGAVQTAPAPRRQARPSGENLQVRFPATDIIPVSRFRAPSCLEGWSEDLVERHREEARVVTRRRRLLRPRLPRFRETTFHSGRPPKTPRSVTAITRQPFDTDDRLPGDFEPGLLRVAIFAGVANRRSLGRDHRIACKTATKIYMEDM